MLTKARTNIIALVAAFSLTGAVAGGPIASDAQAHPLTAIAQQMEALMVQSQAMQEGTMVVIVNHLNGNPRR